MISENSSDDTAWSRLDAIIAFVLLETILEYAAGAA